MLARWLHFPLFRGHGAYGWERLQGWELGYLLVSACLPVLVWLLLSCWLLQRLRSLPAYLLAVFLALLSVVYCEADALCYQITRAHLSWREIHMVFTESSGHIGWRAVDLENALTLLAVHAAAVVALLGSSALLARLRMAIPRLPRPMVLAVLTLAATDLCLVAIFGGGREAPENAWREVTDRNPARITCLDRSLGDLFWGNEGVRLANQRLAELIARPAPPAMHRDTVPPVGGKIKRVLWIVGESLRPEFIDAEGMPFLHSLESKGLRLLNHYANANCTHYSLLSLIHGESPYFYRGPEPSQPMPSPYLQPLHDAGFESVFLSSDQILESQAGAYLGGFSLPAVVAEDWPLVTSYHRLAKEHERLFAILFFTKTHFPYWHAHDQDRFLPEVDDRFDYSRWDAAEHRQEIINRYRNGLIDFDKWLQQLIARYDCSETLVVITSDHGEEFYEHGRLAHASSLDEVQIRIPALLIGPGIEAGSRQEISSNQDLWPTVAALLGLNLSQPESGRSLLHESAGGAAFVAHNQHTAAPRRWAVIAGGRKVLLKHEGGTVPRITALLDLDDRPLAYVSGAWDENLRHVAELCRRLMQEK